MIIIRISGGLGNQLFQYALGRTLAVKRNHDLVFDISSYNYGFSAGIGRFYTLDKFNIHGRIATPQDFKEINIPVPTDKSLIARLKRKNFRIKESFKTLSKKRIILEPTFAFIPEILDVKDTAYLAGVWQSEKYFKEIENIVRTEITLKEPLSINAEKLKKNIKETQSVAIHIRRGDMVNNPASVEKYGLLDTQYYKKAINHIYRYVKNPHFYVFSDEIDWVKKNMDLGDSVVYVSSQQLPDYEELILMSLCMHQIIAKSSFSWWGAWLNQNNNKIVIAPKKRFKTDRNDDKDLIPNSWIQY